MDAEIRSRAFDFWTKAGKPEGEALEFWLEAENELLREPTAQGEVSPGMTDNLPI